MNERRNQTNKVLLVVIVNVQEKTCRRQLRLEIVQGQEVVDVCKRFCDEYQIRLENILPKVKLTIEEMKGLGQVRDTVGKCDSDTTPHSIYVHNTTQHKRYI